MPWYNPFSWGKKEKVTTKNVIVNGPTLPMSEKSKVTNVISGKTLPPYTGSGTTPGYSYTRSGGRTTYHSGATPATTGVTPEGKPILTPKTITPKAPTQKTISQQMSGTKSTIMDYVPPVYRPKTENWWDKFKSWGGAGSDSISQIQTTKSSELNAPERIIRLFTDVGGVYEKHIGTPIAKKFFGGVEPSEKERRKVAGDVGVGLMFLAVNPLISSGVTSQSEYIFDYSKGKFIRKIDVSKSIIKEDFLRSIKSASKKDVTSWTQKQLNLIKKSNLFPEEKARAVKELYGTIAEAKGGIVTRDVLSGEIVKINLGKGMGVVRPTTTTIEFDIRNLLNLHKIKNIPLTSSILHATDNHWNQQTKWQTDLPTSTSINIKQSKGLLLGSGVDILGRTKQISSSKSKIKGITKQKTSPIQKQPLIQLPKLAQPTLQIPKLKTPQVSKFSLWGGMGNPFKKFPKTKGMPLGLFPFPKFKSYKIKKKRGKPAVRKTIYTPTITALSLGLTASKIPELYRRGMGGLISRPRIKRKVKRKKKVRKTKRKTKSSKVRRRR